MSDTNYTLAARLTNPGGAVKDPTLLRTLEEKVNNVMTRMFQKPENGGNPFLYSIAMSKPHELKTELPGIKGWRTAATDGKRFYWHPEFLQTLDLWETSVVMNHEVLHDLFFHCPRGIGRQYPRIWNWAIDYVVNSVIWDDHDKTNRGSKANRPKPFGGNLGEPLSLEDLLKYIDGNAEVPKTVLIFADKTLYGRSPESIYDEIVRHMEKSPRRCPSCGKLTLNPKTGKPNPKKKGQQPGQKGQQGKQGQKGQQPGDGQDGQGQDQQGQGGQQPGDQPGQGPGQQPGDGQGDGQDGQGGGQDDHCQGHGHGQPGQGQGQGGQPGQGQGQPGQSCGGDQGDCCPNCGEENDPFGGFDEHLPSKSTKDDIQSDMMRAAQRCKAMGIGSVPGAIEDALAELMRPQLRFRDIVRNCMVRKSQDAGLKNDWSRCRKRYLAASPSQYLPKRYNHKPRWIAMIDTSGSMGDDDIAYGISQLQVLGPNTDGYIIPCDSAPKWDAIKKVDSKTDLKKTKIVGRGGTAFDDFFRDFPKHLGTDFDVVVVITDADCPIPPRELRPPCDVVWVITNNRHRGFKPAFGRVAPLRDERL